MSLGKPNIAMVAKKAGVAKSTVSRYLNGGSISPAMRAKLARLVAELGYYPSVTARNFARSRTGSLGLVVENAEGDWLIQILAGIEEACSRAQVSVLLNSLVLRGVYDSSIVSLWIRERRVDGLIFARATRREQGVLEEAAKAGMPMAMIGPDVDVPKALVLKAENRRAGEELAEHLWMMGHRRIAFVGGPQDSIDTQDRLAGIRAVLQRRKGRLADLRFLSFSAIAGRQYAAEWMGMARPKRPSAVVLGNDESALGFMRAVQQDGVRIPEEVSVAGFDDARQAGQHWPGLTSAAQPAREMGAAACQGLLTQLQNGQSPASPIRFPMHLVIRESTGPWTEKA